jgi:transcriptional regulator with XRE-family HTH domain
MTDNTRLGAFGAWLRGQRAARRLRQTELAVALDTTTWTLRRWERDEHLPIKVTDIVALARWAKVPPSDVFALVVQDLGAGKPAP